ncbi:Beta-taxilin [Nibea albiflora]|uniref:Beta-taxilin n=1 Tax=Nibea albiflora TaxID=240163 RepID=A0ACB7FBJ7_NIBAL|nr:Beta-taxilin [Nibea albiflora]
MEMSVKATEVLVPPQPDMDAESEAPPADCASADFFDPMEEFSRRLEDIISTYGSAASVMDRQSVVDAEMEKMKTETKEDIAVAMETEVSLVMQSLNKLSSPEEKLEDLVRRYAELAALRRCDDRKLCVLQQKLSVLLDQRQQLQADSRSSVAARSKLEALCKELQRHYDVLRAETLQRCREDEEKRKEMTSHFQVMLTEIQAQIEQHSVRNDKLCHENTNLTEKLESLMGQCELREESLEKINKRRDLQQKLTEAKLQQANALLAEAEEKHKREKEYLLREAIDKTKKCFAMKEQELAMKKKLTLYAQKFDEFQETLSKSNEIYVRFKKEMDNMSGKMKKMEKESNLWKTRFENCNKALTDMIEERKEKGKEYEVFVLKIEKLEKLCRALQEERAVLYEKIKEVRQANSNVQSIVLAGSKPDAVPEAEFQTKTKVKEDVVSVPEQVKSEPVLPDKDEEVQKPAVSPAEPPTPAEKTSELTDAKPEAVNVQTQEKDKDEATQQQSEPLPKSEPEKVTDLEPEAAEAAEVQPVDEQQVQAEAVQAEEEEAPEKKQTPKKKKKRNVKNVS